MDCYIIKEFFFINHFSIIILYHSVWLGFELFGLRVQVYSQFVQFMLDRKGYDNHHCHYEPQIESELECEWRHARKRWSWEDEDLEKESVEGWHWTMELSVGDLAIESKSWVFRISAGRDELRSKTPRDVANVGVGLA